MEFATIRFQSFEKSIPEVLDKIKAAQTIARQTKILIKPNLVNASPHPITTSPACCEAIIQYIRKHSKAKIIIAEGCGDGAHETPAIFQALGYTTLAQQYDLELIDLNHAPLKKVTHSGCRIFPEMVLPKIAFTHFIISVPVLKAHSLAGMTGSLKNMMGFAPPKYYAGRFGSWKKSVFHGNMQQSIIDLNQYIAPHLSIMDAGIGLAEFHLGGARCSPPVKKMIAGYNPWEVDQAAAGLLGLDLRNILHIQNGFKSSHISNLFND
jgi:uncharacterized protein (DUF362 family)